MYRHREIRQHQDEDLSLVYAEALLRHALVRPSLEYFPCQVVVIGPTQAGKSSLVNVLLNQDAAVASPLAGYTRHAHGFSNKPVTPELMGATDALLAELDRVEPEQISPDHLDTFTLSPASSVGSEEMAMVIWDTPDFDSVSSRSYRSTVPLLAALADLVVVVVSKDKYADQSVWESLRLLDQMKRPLLVCVNKVPEDSLEQFHDIVSDKFDEENISFSKLVVLPYIMGNDPESLRQSEPAVALREQFTGLLEPVDLDAEAPQLQDFISSHWDEWTNQIKLEQSARREWQEQVDEAVETARESYTREYLQQPHYDDTLKRAIVELLDLLELPGIARGLASARQAITWPVRTLTSFLKKQPLSDGETPAEDNETQILHEAIDHALVELSRSAGEQAVDIESNNREWWQHLWQQSLQSEHETEQKAIGWIKNHQEEFSPHISAAAQSLYEHLQEHPIKLNALRATRVTADAAALGLALKTGGIGLNDLVLAPAMLSFTSMLTEGAVGSYMNSVERELKELQQASVEKHILDMLRTELEQRPDSMPNQGLFNLSDEDLEAAETALESLNP